ncbi:MAG: hypothetical protein ACTHLR_09950 [Rhizomicrobium sp.]
MTKWAIALIVLLAGQARAADDVALERMATCRDSWLDWQKTNPAKLQKFGEDFRAHFAPHGDDPFPVPRVETTVAGLRVTKAFPDSVGMGVGFSLMVDASFDRTRKAMERSLGRRMQHCENGDNMKTCAIEVAQQRTFVVMAEDSPKATQTLLGCYYFYEK